MLGIQFAKVLNKLLLLLGIIVVVGNDDSVFAFSA